MKISLFIFVSILLGISLALDCGGPADIVLAVPGSRDSVPDDEFQHLEDFLTRFLSYFDISADGANVGLILYGREPVVISNLEDATSRQAINARVTLLTQRSLVNSQIAGGQNVPKAIEKVHELLSNGREAVPKIGVIMTYGSDDLTSTSGQVVSERVANVSKSALDDEIVLFATSSGGTVPGFQNITRNFCRLFSLGFYADLGVLLPYLASASCYVLDDSVNITHNHCFPVVQQPPPRESFQCGPTSGDLVPDPTNCAYWYTCPSGQRMPCDSGLMYDPEIQRCNHKEFVTCYSGLTCPSEDGLFPHPDDCGKFLSCSENIPHVHDCLPGLWYNSEEKYCDYQINVNCEKR